MWGLTDSNRRPPALSGRGSSHEARKYEYELSNYYSYKHRPIHDFKKQFFSGWSNDYYQWMTFDSLMMYAVKEYLQKGVVESEPIKINNKKFVTDTSKSFVEWATSFDLTINTKLAKKTLFNDYESYCEDTPDCDIRLFGSWLKVYAGYNNLIPVEAHSGSVRYIEFRPK